MKAAEDLVVGCSAMEAPAVERTWRQVVDEDLAFVHRVTQDEPAESVTPAVMRGRGRPEVRLVLVIPGPADAGVGDRAVDRLQVGFGDLEAGADRGRLERCEDGAGRIAGTGEFQQVEKGGDCGAFGEALPTDAVVDLARGAEDRLDQRCVGVEVGSQQEDVGGLDVGVGVEDAEQAIVQDLDFAGRGVADVNLERVVVGRGNGFPAVTENVALHRVESAAVRRPGRVGRRRYEA